MRIKSSGMYFCQAFCILNLGKRQNFGAYSVLLRTENETIPTTSFHI